ncbi:hypothetical protein J6590_061231 [Homalodisca vitripennis]|nr:hypothetical protein J6590_061231 [Homalodisca vitripennis]
MTASARRCPAVGQPRSGSERRRHTDTLFTVVYYITLECEHVTAERATIGLQPSVEAQMYERLSERNHKMTTPFPIRKEYTKEGQLGPIVEQKRRGGKGRSRFHGSACDTRFLLGTTYRVLPTTTLHGFSPSRCSRIRTSYESKH